MSSEVQVLLDVDYRHGVFELVLVNLGQDPAYDVRVEFSRRIVGVGGTRTINDLPLFHRLSMLRPGKEIRVFLDAAGNVFRRRRAGTFTATVSWRDAKGTAQAAKFRHDLDAYRDLPQIADEP